jgi:hypothetical protein
MFFIATSHHLAERLSTCIVFNPATTQWVPLPRAGHVSPLTEAFANDLALTLQEAQTECYVVTARQLTDMMARRYAQENS